MGPVMIVSGGEGVSSEEGLEPVDLVRQIVDGVEFVRHAPLQRSTAPLSWGRFGRQHEEFEALVAAGLFEAGRNSDPPSTWMAALEGHVGDDLVEEGGARLAVAARDAGDGPFGDRVVRGEVLDVAAGSEADEDGVDLNDLSGAAGLRPFGRRRAVTPIRRKRRPPG